MSRNSGNQPGGIFSTEYSNKIILLLLGVLILFVFLDFQARRKSAPAANLESSGTALHPVLEPIRDKAEFVLGRSEETQGGAGRIPAGGGSVSAGVPTTGTGNREIYRNGPVLRPVEPTAAQSESFYLFFLRFKGSRLNEAQTELVRVRRPLPKGEVTLKLIIAQLQAGPLTSERGLLNAFDEGIKVTDAYVDQGIACVYVDKAIGSLGTHIIQDRLDQLVLTLSQFPEIQGVKILVDGSPVESLGDSRFPLPALLRPTSRAVFE